MDKIKAIVTTAQRMFSQNGYENTTVNDIAKEAGVAGGTIIYHFKNKENLLFIVAWNVLNSLYKKTASKLPTSTNGMETVTAFVAAFFHFLRENQAAYRMLLRNTVFDTLDTRAFPNADLKMLHKRYRMLLEEAVSRGLKDGSIADAVPEEVTAAIVSYLCGSARLHEYFGHSLEILEKEAQRFTQARLSSSPIARPHLEIPLSANCM